MPDEGPQAQLQMVWPAARLEAPPAVVLPKGYRLRQYADGDADAYLALMQKAGFRTWDREQLAKTLPSVLPGGFFLVEEEATGRLVATAMARRRAIEGHPNGGELSWVAADPEHKGRRLGAAVCAAVVARFLQAGYRDIYLLTDDWRLAAVEVYLRLGFEPFLSCEGMAERWARVLARLGRER